MFMNHATSEGCDDAELSISTSHLKAPPHDLDTAPVVLLLAGALSPITYMHLRLLGKQTKLRSCLKCLNVKLECVEPV